MSAGDLPLLAAGTAPTILLVAAEVAGGSVPGPAYLVRGMRRRMVRHGGPANTRTVARYAIFGHCLLVIAAILALRLLVPMFRSGTR